MSFIDEIVAMHKIVDKSVREAKIQEKLNTLRNRIDAPSVKMLFDPRRSIAAIRGPITNEFLKVLVDIDVDLIETRQKAMTVDDCRRRWKMQADRVIIYTTENHAIGVKNRYGSSYETEDYQDGWTFSEWEMQEAIETGNRLNIFHFGEFLEAAKQNAKSKTPYS